MAQLILVPNPVVMAVQAGVFLTGAVIIKKLMIEPYLSVRDRRVKLTQGNREEAAEIISRCEAIASEVNSRLSQAVQKAQKSKETIRLAAVERRDALVAAAESESRATIDKVAAEIQQVIATERAKVPQVVEQLAQQVFQLAVQ